MCGEIRKSPDAETAVQWAIAYARSYEAGPDYVRWGDGLPDDTQRRSIAQSFIDGYTPSSQRAEATSILDGLPDDRLDNNIDYWNTIVD